VFFFGAQDEFVGRWAYDDKTPPSLVPEISVWEKSTATFLCRIRDKGVHNIRAIAVNPSQRSIMFATSNPRKVSLWTPPSNLEKMERITNGSRAGSVGESLGGKPESLSRRRARLFREASAPV